MSTIKLENVVLECVQGDITQQPDMDAIVNAANALLMPGGGVAGAIHRAAGPELAAACRPLAPIQPGTAVVTGAYRLPNRFVIHCLGPVYGVNEPSDVLLASCYREALRLAEEHRVSSIAFPAISTGAFGYPVDGATRVALGSVSSQVETLGSVRHIRFVLFGRADLGVYESVFAELAQDRRGTATG